MIVAVNHPLGTQFNTGVCQPLSKPCQTIAGGRQTRLPAEKPELVAMLRRDAGNQIRRRADGVGHHQRQRAVAGTAVKQHHRQLFAELEVIGVVVHTGGDDQPVNLAGNHIIDHHGFLAGVFVGTGDQQLNARLAAEHFQLMREDGKSVVGDFRHHQTDGVAAVIAQRAGVNTGLIMLFARNRQHALAGILRHA